ncbi:8-amino-7-oxononanoate synthase [Nocardioides pyridinolyticus]
MTGALEAWLADRAEVLERRGLTRRLRPRSLPAEAGVVVDLAGNDYLGLSTDARLVDAAVGAIRDWGTGATGSRLVTGTTGLHVDLEEALADLCGQEAALVFSSGYLANLGAVTTLAGPGTLIVQDAHVHASLIDAARLSRSPVAVVPHNDVAAVEDALRGREQTRALVLTESVFSVLGDAAPLPRLAEVCGRYGAVLLVDEAHGVGVTGAGGGSVAATGLAEADHVVVTATLSKALASQGGVVLGSARLKEHLVNRARSFIFDTALAPAAAAAALTAVRVIRDEPKRVERIGAVAGRLAAACGVPVGPGGVFSVPMPTPEAALAAAGQCADHGLRVGCFRPPSVPDGISRMRLTARATLDEAAIDHACAVLADALEEAR